MAEAKLSEAKGMSGFSVLLLQILVAEGMPDPVRTLAAIVLKQVIEDYWNTEGGTLPQIPDSDKLIIRENIVQALLHCHPQVAAQLKEGIKKVIQHDWPSRWPELVPRIMDIIKTQQDPRVLEGAVFCYCAVVKKSEWKTKKREKMYALVETTFPFIFEFLTHIRTINTPESYSIQKLIAKTFYSCFQLKMPPYLLKDEVLGPWLAKFMEILMSPLPEGEPEDPAMKAEWAPWKTKKWCVHIFNRLFVRFGDPLISKKKEKKAWAKHFVKNYATKILEGVLQILDLKKTGMFMPNTFSCALMRFITTSIRHTSTWPILAPKCPGLLVDVLIPITCFTEEDNRIWNEDPQEYIRKEYDILEDYYSMKIAALDIIGTLAQTRKDETFGFILEMVVNLFKQYEAMPDNLKNPQRLEGGLNIFGSLSEEYMSNEKYNESLDPLVAQYLIPHLENKHGFVIARACSAFGRYSTYIESGELVVEGTKRVLAAMNHPELPTRVQAAVSLRYIVQTDDAKPLLQSVLPDIFQSMFSLINEVDNDDLVSALDSIIFEFRHSIGPFAVAICEKLTNQLFRLSANIDLEDEDNCDAAILAAAECGRTLVTVMGSVRKTPELYPQIFQVVLPFLKTAAKDTENEDSFENAMKILAFISYCIPKPFPAELWLLLAEVVSPVESFPVDFIEDVVPFMDNMITRDPETFVHAQHNGTTFLQLIWDLLSSILNQSGAELEGIECLKLLEVILQNCRGTIDPLIPLILEVVIARIGNAEDPKFTATLFGVFGNMLFYNPLLTLQCCEQRNATVEIMKNYCGLSESLPRQYDRKQISLGLSSLLQIPLSQWPASLQALAPHMVGVNITLLNKMIEHEKDRLKKEAERAAAGDASSGVLPSPLIDPSTGFASVGDLTQQIRNDEDEDDDDYEGDGVIDDDADDDDFDNIIQQIQGGDLYGLGGGLDEDSDDEYDGLSDDEGFDDDDESLSEFDKIDEISFFMEQLLGSMQREPEPYNQLMGTLPQEMKVHLDGFSEEAKRRELIRQQRAAEKK